MIRQLSHPLTPSQLGPLHPASAFPTRQLKFLNRAVIEIRLDSAALYVVAQRRRQGLPGGRPHAAVQDEDEDQGADGDGAEGQADSDADLGGFGEA